MSCLYLKKYHTHQFIAVISIANGSALVLVMTWTNDGPYFMPTHLCHKRDIYYNHFWLGIIDNAKA